MQSYFNIQSCPKCSGICSIYSACVSLPRNIPPNPATQYWSSGIPHPEHNNDEVGVGIGKLTWGSEMACVPFCFGPSWH
eukprot:4749481-Amphidinium_carterae.1